jgi:hypothetical protein
MKRTAAVQYLTDQKRRKEKAFSLTDMKKRLKKCPPLNIDRIWIRMSITLVRLLRRLKMEHVLKSLSDFGQMRRFQTRNYPYSWTIELLHQF